jgi:hypothetical protein
MLQVGQLVLFCETDLRLQTSQPLRGCVTSGTSHLDLFACWTLWKGPPPLRGCEKGEDMLFPAGSPEHFSPIPWLVLVLPVFGFLLRTGI